MSSLSLVNPKVEHSVPDAASLSVEQRGVIASLSLLLLTKPSLYHTHVQLITQQENKFSAELLPDQSDPVPVAGGYSTQGTGLGICLC